MIDLRYPLAVLSSHMPRQEVEASLAGVIARKVRAVKMVVDIDLVGPVVQVSSRTQHTDAVEEAQASFCPNLATVNSRITCTKKLISPSSLTWKTELFSTD